MPGQVFMPELEISVPFVGKAAREALSEARGASVCGVTSRGIFLRVEQQKMVFLSFEAYRGPLTLNLGGKPAALSRLEQGDFVEIQDGDLYFPRAGACVVTGGAETWEPPLPPASALTPSERNLSMKAVAGEMLAQRRPAGLGEALAGLFEPGKASPVPAAYPGLDLGELRRALRRPDPAGALAALAPLLGLGAGLTPSGDDLIGGLLLAYNRWEAVIRPAFELAELYEAITTSTFQKTTLVSANLIACAARGQADERLITALDGMMCGVPATAACAEALLDWGSSSGFDALMGMVLASGRFDELRHIDL